MCAAGGGRGYAAVSLRSCRLTPDTCPAALPCCLALPLLPPPLPPPCLPPSCPGLCVQLVHTLHPQMSALQVDQLYLSLDTNRDGMVTKEEFMVWYDRKEFDAEDLA